MDVLGIGLAIDKQAPVYITSFGPFTSRKRSKDHERHVSGRTSPALPPIIDRKLLLLLLSSGTGCCNSIPGVVQLRFERLEGSS
jgi:hypothetical protein